MKRYIITMLMCSYTMLTFAQYNPLKSQYFQNPYLANPAMAGHSGAAELYATYANQWSKMEGTPKVFSVNGSIPLNEKVALGASVMSDRAGLLSKTNAMATFAYKLKFDEAHGLRFGASLTWSQDRIDLSRSSNSSALDPEMYSYNERENYMDGNLGVTYQLQAFEAQFSYLSLNQRRYSELSTLDYAQYYSAVSYKFDIDNDVYVKPLIAYRAFKGIENQADFAAELGFQTLRLYTMYHTNKSLTGGIGYLDKSGLIFSTMYNSGGSALKGFGGGSFDISLGIKI